MLSLLEDFHLTWPFLCYILVCGQSHAWEGYGSLSCIFSNHFTCVCSSNKTSRKIVLGKISCRAVTCRNRSRTPSDIYNHTLPWTPLSCTRTAHLRSASDREHILHFSCVLYPFLHSFIRDLWSSYYVSGTMPGTRATMVNGMHVLPSSHRL